MIEWKSVSTPPAEKEIVLVTCKYLKIPIMAVYKDGRYLLPESQAPLPLTAVAWTPMPEVVPIDYELELGTEFEYNEPCGEDFCEIDFNEDDVEARE